MKIYTTERFSDYFKWMIGALIFTALLILLSAIILLSRLEHIAVWMWSPIDSVPAVALRPSSTSALSTVTFPQVEFEIPSQVGGPTNQESIAKAGFVGDRLSWSTGELIISRLGHKDITSWEWKLQVSEDKTYAERVAHLYGFSSSRFSFLFNRQQLAEYRYLYWLAKLCRYGEIERVEIHDTPELSALVCVPSQDGQRHWVVATMLSRDEEIFECLVRSDNVTESVEIVRAVVRTFREKEGPHETKGGI
ncbi:hypothetical protein [Schlesneria sp. T3-172]|uniref:hypothetical protein n=1 Tax=Schlesneria sphaerica TaxID=3373610 RepID=UPI0037C8BB83